jgi:hypothetical protein
MTCHTVTLDNGARAIVCTSGPRKLCVQCGQPARLLCDWKVPEHRSGTCDAPICAGCTHSPAPDKDLCPGHAAQWKSGAYRRRPSESAG